MPLFATCTIANAILALCAPPDALTFSSWVCAVPFRFDTLAGFRLARRIPGVRCRALRCVPVSRCNAGGSACLLACRAAALARPCSCSCGRATSAAICHGYRAPAYLAGTVGQTVHADHCDGFDQALAARHGSTGAARRWYSGCGCNRFRDGLRHVFARAARQRTPLRFAAAIVHVAHDCIVNP